MTAADNYIQRLEESEPLREAVLRFVVGALRLPHGSRGLDVGCGIGYQTARLAECVGPAGHVTGLDFSPELLARAGQIVKQAGLAERVALRAGDMRRLPFTDQTFDWVWSADCAGYPAGELLPVLRELARVTRPGGSVAILAWSSQRLLPGYPLLEARLDAACSAYAPYVNGFSPETQFLRASRWFHEAGLREVSVQTFVGEVSAPLDKAIRRALASLFEMLWEQPQPGVAAADWVEYQRLCRPESPDFIADLPEYYAFFTYTMFCGKVDGSGGRS